MSEKLAVLYGYNPNEKAISKSTKLKVLKEQLGYENAEYSRLQKARATKKNFSGVNLRFIEGKTQKIKKLEKQIKEIEEENRGEQ